MTQFTPCNRGQWFLLPPDAEKRLAADDVAYVKQAARERVPFGAFTARWSCPSASWAVPWPSAARRGHARRGASGW
jgi:hypothetical protein